MKQVPKRLCSIGSESVAYKSTRVPYISPFGANRKKNTSVLQHTIVMHRKKSKLVTLVLSACACYRLTSNDVIEIKSHIGEVLLSKSSHLKPGMVYIYVYIVLT